MVKTALAAAISALAVAPLLAPTNVLAEAPSFSQGMSDRAAWETWFGSLGVEGKDGAAFWADQRSRPNPLSCDQPNRSTYWIKGCSDAHDRLAASDQKRANDPTYRKGWNSYQAAGAGTVATPVANVVPPPLPPAKPWAPLPSDPRLAVAAQDCTAYRIRPSPYYIPPAYRDGEARCEADKRQAQASLDVDKARYDEEQHQAHQRREEARQLALEQSPDNKCRFSYAAIVLREANEALGKRGLEVIDIEHLFTLPSNPTNPDSISCHGVFMMSNGLRVPGTLTERQNVAGEAISEFRSDFPVPRFRP